MAQRGRDDWTSVGALSPRTFVGLGLIFAVGTLAVVIAGYSSQDLQLSGYGSWLQTALSIYLVFMFARTIGHLTLSFASIFFAERPETASTHALVSVIIPCYNEELVIGKAVSSVLELTYPNIEILVIDDGSRDETLLRALPLEVRDKVRVIHQSNAGKAAALNRGISEAMGDYVFCMDADSVLAPDTLEQGLAWFTKGENIAAVAGTVEIGNPNHVLTEFQRLEYVSGLNLFKTAQSYLGMVTVIPGPVGLFRLACVLEVGGYLSNTFAEDCELTIRLLMHGYTTVYEPRMIARTEAPETLRELVQQRYRWSRGVVQAIQQNLFWIRVEGAGFRNFFVLAYVWIESIFIPVCNFLFAFLSIEYALSHDTAALFGQFFLDLMVLDVILALFCVVLERAPASLLLAATVNRFTYGFALEILRFFAIVDELLGLPMSWGKLVRKGMGATTK